MNSSIVKVRARAFAGSTLAVVEVSVDDEGSCFVRDPISRTWTRCHALTVDEQMRAVRKARADLRAQARQDREYAAGQEWQS